jgi:hypothetical protein
MNNSIPSIDISLNRYIHRGVIGGIILLGLGLSGCGVPRALVRDCQDVKDTQFKNCEVVQKL